MKTEVKPKSKHETAGLWTPQIARELRQPANIAGWHDNMSGAQFVELAVREALARRGIEVSERAA